MHRIARISVPILSSICIAGPAMAQQGPDTAWAPSVTRPAYTGGGPRVGIDDAGRVGGVRLPSRREMPDRIGSISLVERNSLTGEPSIRGEHQASDTRHELPSSPPTPPREVPP